MTGMRRILGSLSALIIAAASMIALIVGTPSAVAATVSVCDSGSPSNEPAAGGTIDLFDYKVNDNGISTTEDYNKDTNINGNGTSGLGFRFGLNNDSKDEEGYYDSSGNITKQPFVTSSLSDGQPAGNSKRTSTSTSGTGYQPTSLAYLFNKSTTAAKNTNGTSYSGLSKDSYTGINANSLLTKDSSGTWSFDSSRQYAYYDTSTDSKSFTLTDSNPITTTYSTQLADEYNYNNKQNGTSKTGLPGGFFPFNTSTEAEAANSTAVENNTLVIKFTVSNANTASGQAIYIVGSGLAGDDAPWTAAYRLNYSDGSWEGYVPVSKSKVNYDKVEFKAIKAPWSASTRVSTSSLHITDSSWEPYDGNSTISMSNTSGGVYHLSHTWGTKQAEDAANLQHENGGVGYVNSVTGTDDGTAGSYFSSYTSDGKNLVQLDHYFGMHLNKDFYMNSSGTTSSGDPVEFNFQGDDDAYLYIDGILFLNLGGTHTALSGKLNLKTGEVSSKNVTGLLDNGAGRASDGSSTAAYSGVEYATHQAGSTLVAIATASGTTTTKNGVMYNSSGKAVLDTTTGRFVSGTHTLDMFYLERGAEDSNLKVSYNMSTAPTTSVTKDIIDSDGKAATDGSAEYGSTVTYRTTITDDSSDGLDDSTRYMRDELPSGVSYDGNGVTWTKTSPDGAQTTGTADDVSYDKTDNVLTWAVTGLTAGSSIAYMYTVTVTGAAGSSQTNGVCTVGTDRESDPGLPAYASFTIPVSVEGTKMLTAGGTDASSQIGTDGYVFYVLVRPVTSTDPIPTSSDGTSLTTTTDSEGNVWYKVPVTYSIEMRKATWRFSIGTSYTDSGRTDDSNTSTTSTTRNYYVREMSDVSGNSKGVTYDGTTYKVSVSTDASSTVVSAGGTDSVKRMSTSRVTAVDESSGDSTWTQDSDASGVNTGSVSGIAFTNSVALTAHITSTGSRAIPLLVGSALILGSIGVGLYASQGNDSRMRLLRRRRHTSTGEDRDRHDSH